MKQRNVVFFPHRGTALITYGNKAWKIDVKHPGKVFSEAVSQTADTDSQAEFATVEERYPFNSIRKELDTRVGNWKKQEEGIT